MNWPERRGKGWDEFNGFVGTLINKRRPSEYDVEFRGQADADWPLTHSLTRELSSIIDEESAINIEREALKKFQEQAHLVLDSCGLPDREDLPGWWAIMQHHNAPTRLLDWTKSPFVALYFAVVNQPEKDGAVWMFHGGGHFKKK